MAIAAPHVKLLRQLAKAKDDYLSGAFDIEWDRGSATIFMVFGQPSHAVFESGGTRLAGEPALDALLRELPAQFTVGDWRRAMSPQDTLSVSIDDITEPIAELVGEHSAVADRDEDATSWLGGLDDSPELGFDVDSFPLLPHGDVLWPDTPAEDAAVTERLSSLDAALIVLTGPRLHAAGVVRDGDLIDAVWVDSADHARGETAAIALLGAREGVIAGYALDSFEVAEAIPMLWRLPRGDAIATAWVDGQALLTSLLEDREDHALLIDGPERAVGLFSGGRAIAVYTSTDPAPVTSTDLLLDVMRKPGTTLRVLQRRARVQRNGHADAVVAQTAPSTSPAPSSPPAPYDAFDVLASEETPSSPLEILDNAAETAVERQLDSAGWSVRETSRASDPANVSEPFSALDEWSVVEPSTTTEPWSIVEPSSAIEPPSAFEASSTTAPSSGVDTSSWVDYDEVRADLVAIGVAWLGENDSAAVTECVLGTQSAVEDFLTTIETIRRMTIPGHDSTAIYSMTREMQLHAAERLCGA